MTASPDALVVAVLGPGRLGETHLAALARLRERGLDVDGRRVAVVPALYGRNAARVRRAGRALRRRTHQHRAGRADRRARRVGRGQLPVQSPALRPADARDRRGQTRVFGKAADHRAGRGRRSCSRRPARRACSTASFRTCASTPARGARAADRSGPRGSHLQRQRAVRLHGAADRPEPTDVVLQEGRSRRRHRRGHDGPLLRPAADAGRADRRRLRRARASPGTSAASPTARRSRSRSKTWPASASAFANGAVGSCFATWVRRKHEEVPTFQIDGEDGSLYFTLNRLWSQTQAADAAVSL